MRFRESVLRRGLSLPYSDLSSGYRLYRRAALAVRALLEGTEPDGAVIRGKRPSVR